MTAPRRRREVARVVAAAATWVTIGVHLDLVNDHLEEKPYVGVLFVVGVVLLIPVVHGLARTASRRVCGFGAVVNLGMLVALVASRTVGLPGAFHETWADDHFLGIVTGASEVVFLGAAWPLMGGARRAGSGELPTSPGCARSIGWDIARRRLRPGTSPLT